MIVIHLGFFDKVQLSQSFVNAVISIWNVSSITLSEKYLGGTQLERLMTDSFDSHKAFLAVHICFFSPISVLALQFPRAKLVLLSSSVSTGIVMPVAESWWQAAIVTSQHTGHTTAARAQPEIGACLSAAHCCVMRCVAYVGNVYDNITQRSSKIRW